MESGKRGPDGPAWEQSMAARSVFAGKRQNLKDCTVVRPLAAPARFVSHRTGGKPSLYFTSSRKMTQVFSTFHFQFFIFLPKTTHCHWLPVAANGWKCVVGKIYLAFAFSERMAMIRWITMKKHRMAAMVTLVHQVFRLA